MALTPEQIEGQQFVASVRGCDRREVETFLRVVADEQRRLLSQLDDARRTASEVVPAPDIDLQVGAEVAEILRTGRDAAQRVREEAERDAREILRLAKAQAEEMTRAAEHELTSATSTAAAIHASAAAEAANMIDQAKLEVAAVHEEAESHLFAAANEAAELVERARASAVEIADEARVFRDQVLEEAVSSLSAARTKADAMLAHADAQRRQLFTAHAEIRAKLTGSDAALQNLLRRVDEIGEALGEPSNVIELVAEPVLAIDAAPEDDHDVAEVIDLVDAAGA